MTHALRSYSLLFATLILIAACGASAPNEDTGSDGGAASIDADVSCQGCIDVFGNCEPGDKDRDCGGGGASCETCLNGAVCAEGECLVPPTCTPENCAGGCCEGSTCVLTADQGATQCGADGLACTNCDSGLCNAGVCVEACSPVTCTGCCNGPTIDDCIEVGNTQTALACGVEGLACAACDNGATCTQGACVDTACNLDCPSGCCDGSTCRDGDDNVQCGTGGEACFSCGADQTCSAGVCVVDPNSLWNFVIVSADVPVSGDWDPFGGAPDPFVEVTLGVDTAAPVSGESARVDNTFTPKFSPPNGEVVISNVPASKILDSIRLRVYDYDSTSANDLMISIIDNMPPEAVFGGTLFQLSVDGFTVRFRIVKP